MYSYESILQRMLNRVPSNYDKRQGSIIWNSLAPDAAELAQAYIQLNIASDSTSIDTAIGDKLTELCYQNGTFRKGATKSIRNGKFNIEVPIGSRFNGEDNTSYIVLEKIVNYEYKLECEQYGEIGNSYSGRLIPIDYIEGLKVAELTDIIVEGVEEETDDQLRNRHKRRIVEGEQDGNVAQYKDWADNYSGIGTSKVFPLWNGGNTVKIAITNRQFQVADSTLVNSFQEYLDPGSKGLGNGKAPIGSKVTVTGGVKKEINITGNVELVEGYSNPEGVAEMISKYFASITYRKNSVNYIRLGSSILDTNSIAGLSEFRANGGIEDIPLVGEEIPTLNSLNLTVVST